MLLFKYSAPHFHFPSYLHSFWHICFVFLILPLLYENWYHWLISGFLQQIFNPWGLPFNSACTVCLTRDEHLWAYACTDSSTRVLKWLDILISKLRLCFWSVLLFFSLPPHPSIPEMGFIFLTSFLGAQEVTFRDF